MTRKIQRYDVTPDGRVLSISATGQRRMELKAAPDTSGYLQHSLRAGGKTIVRRKHALVADKYLPPKPSPEHQLRHLDGNKLNNQAKNLAWGTAKDNANDKRRHRLSHQMDLFGWTESQAACAEHLQRNARHQAQQRLKHKKQNHAVLPGQLKLLEPPSVSPTLGGHQKSK